MALIKLYSIYDVVKSNLGQHKELPLGSLSDKLISVALGEILGGERKAETEDKLTEVCGSFDASIKGDIIKCYHLIIEKIYGLFGDDLPGLNTPYRYARGIITVPFIDKGPTDEQIQNSDRGFIVPIGGVCDLIHKLISPFMELTPAVTLNLAYAYFDYTAKHFFSGFSKENLEHPMSSYFTNEALIDYIFKNFDGKDGDFDFEDYAELDTEDLLTEVFREVDKTFHSFFCEFVNGAKIDEDSVVYLFNTDNTKIKILVDRTDLKTRVFNMVFDHTRGAIKSELECAYGDFCKSNL